MGKMLYNASILLAALVATVSAAPCASDSASATASSAAPSPTLPSTGATDLPLPDTAWTLKKIAVGHGIQNYTCADNKNGTTAASLGALAILYDITSLYPGTPDTGLSPEGWNAIPATVLRTQDIPLNLVNESAASPSSEEDSDADSQPAYPETAFAADTSEPFPDSAPDLTLGPGMEPSPAIGRHYFASGLVPTFDLVEETGLLAVVAKKDNVHAPSSADKGLLDTGAVDWLRLLDNGKNAGVGVQAVYRVVTAGGAAQACSTSGAGAGSVPYAAMYWFYG